MKSLTLALQLSAILGAVTANFVACGAGTNDTASGGTSGNAGKGSTSGSAGTGVASGGSSNNGGTIGLKSTKATNVAIVIDSSSQLLSLLEGAATGTDGKITLRATGAHPGTTATNITASTGSRLKTAVGSLGHRLTGMPAWQGALPTLYAATMDVPGNTYVGPHRLREMNGWPTGVGRSQRALDPDLAKALWAESERLSGVGFPW
jgi:hypothetical protein